MNRNNLHTLIERYFNAETSVEEERMLRHELQRIPVHTDPLADEARAVMGFPLAGKATSGKHTKKLRLSPLPAWRNAAAMIAAAAVTGSIMFGVMRQNNGECVAYLNGQRISDRDAVMEMMLADLNDMGEASSDMQADIAASLSEMADAINNLE